MKATVKIQMVFSVDSDGELYLEFEPGESISAEDLRAISARVDRLATIITSNCTLYDGETITPIPHTVGRKT